MIFSKIAISLISPLGTALVIGAFAMLFAKYGKQRFATWMGLFSLLWLGLWSLPLVSVALRGAIEREFPAPVVNNLSSAPAIVVLGGVVNPPTNMHRQANLTAAADRLRLAAQLFHAGKAPVVVLSGGSNRTLSLTSEADAMRLFLLELGVPESAILLEEQSRNTQENARFTASLLRKQRIDRVLLVTSALHMRRAIDLFELEGLDVVPAPTDFEAREILSWQKFIPDSLALDGSSRAIKELVGRAILGVTRR